MLIEISEKEFHHRFNSDPHPFLSAQFIELNKEKADKIVRLVEDKKKPSIGMIAGIKDGILKSPFSAPFGGFHCRNDSIYVNEIEQFLENLLLYTKQQKIDQITLTLPPSIYQQSVNAKIANTLIRLGFEMALPDITNLIELKYFNGTFSHGNSRNYYRQAVKNQLIFKLLTDDEERITAFDIIRENRSRLGRPLFMTYDDIKQTAKLWPVDIFCVKDTDGEMLASGVFYQFPNQISYTVFLGDSEKGRPLRAMDFLIYNILVYYKSAGFEYIDMGISTESGMPNEGLIRFKETHEAVSSLRFSFTWKA